MRFASVYHGGEPRVVRRGAHGQLQLIEGAAELGHSTDTDWLHSAGERAAAFVDDDDVVLRPVVPAPTRIICLGLNYRAHVDETGRDLPTYPVLFTKWPSSLTAAGADIVLPPESTQVDYEAELAIVIGRAGRRIPRTRALDHVAGVTVANDVTMRDYQYKTHQWLQGKAWDAATPVGPELVTLDEAGPLDQLAISLELNGQELQRSTTALLIFDIPTIVATLSEFTTLDVGDLILTGTPGGVGYRRDPQVFLRPGDEVAAHIAGVGSLTNRIARGREGEEHAH